MSDSQTAAAEATATPSKISLGDLMATGVTLEDVENNIVGDASESSDSLTLPRGVYWGRFIKPEVKDYQLIAAPAGGYILSTAPTIFQAMYSEAQKAKLDRKVFNTFWLTTKEGDRNQMNETALKTGAAAVVAAYHGMKSKDVVDQLNANKTTLLACAQMISQDPQDGEFAPILRVFIDESAETDEYQARNQVNFRKGFSLRQTDWDQMEELENQRASEDTGAALDQLDAVLEDDVADVDAIEAAAVQ